jgi:hypothetical protein
MDEKAVFCPGPNAKNYPIGQQLKGKIKDGILHPIEELLSSNYHRDHQNFY